MSDTPVEETTSFEPRFGPDGLIPAVVADAETGQVLMLAWMNAEALARTLELGEAHFWSRSRASLWRKGETSGETLQVVEVLTDCDQDALLVRAQPQGVGATCHTGRRSCFYRVVEADTPGSLRFRDARRLLDPDRVYGRTPSE